MYVCVCNAVTDSQVEQVIREGAHTREAVTRACGAGGDCGSCHGMIEDMCEAVLEDGGHGGHVIAAAALVRHRAA